MAKLAGVPDKVIKRAKDILGELEQQGGVSHTAAPRSESDQLSMGDLAGSAVLDTLRNTAVETLTPIEAMNLLYQLKQQL